MSNVEYFNNSGIMAAAVLEVNSQLDKHFTIIKNRVGIINNEEYTFGIAKYSLQNEEVYNAFKASKTPLPPKPNSLEGVIRCP